MWLMCTAGFSQANPDSSATISSIVPQRDLIDVFQQVLPRKMVKERDLNRLQEGRPLILVVPQIGYTIQTGLLAQIPVSIALQRPEANVSTLLTAITYTKNNQLLFNSTLNYWLPENKWKITNDLRVMHYPQSTYGLGMFTRTTREINMDYEYLRLYATALRQIRPNLFLGPGYELDLHWNIDSYNAYREFVRISRYPYGVTGRSVTSGLVMNLLYDNRPNAINAVKGVYANAIIRQNLTWLGSQQPSTMFRLDARKYIPLSVRRPENILGLWSYNVLTVSGNPPFLDLPSTGWDTFSNTGRGYIQGRFRGKNLLYAEAEFRFGITADRLFGGVLFANAQTVSEPNLSSSLTEQRVRFARVAPAFGAGLRIRINKLSGTNIAIDYGLGLDGSHGLYFNFGEVF